MDTRMPHNLPRLLAVLAAFLVFGLLLTFRLGAREMALDEAISVGHADPAELHYDAFHPPGYYWLLHRWDAVVGESDGAVRAFSVLGAVGAAGLVWLLARALLEPGEDVLALWLFVLSPFGLLYLRMGRYFALTLVVALAVAYLALLARRQGKVGHYLGLGLAAAALVRVDYIPSLFLPLIYLWLLAEALRRGRFLHWALAAALPVAALAYGLSGAVFGAHSIAGTPAGHAAGGATAVALKLLLPFYAALVGETTDFWRFYLTLPVLAAGAVLWGAGLAALARRRETERGWLLLPWPLAVVAVTAVLSTAAAAEPWPRVSSLCLFALPFFLMTVAAGVSAWGGRRIEDSLAARPRGPEAGPAGWKPAPRGAVLGPVLFAVLLAGQIYGVYNYEARREFLNPGYNVPWRQVVGLIQTQGQAGDVAVAWWDGEVQRYWRGPVRFTDLVDPTLTWRPLPQEVAAFPRGGATVWVIDRDRGSDQARALTDKLLQRLRAAGGVETPYRLLAYAPAERYWRRRLGGGPGAEAYLTLHRFTPSPPPY